MIPRYTHPEMGRIWDDQRRYETWLKVEGSLYQEDAELLEKICRDIGEQTGAPLTLDLADLCFLDSDSASVLCRLKDNGAELVGLHYFIQQIIEAAKNS